jgi:hypothetical protein
VAGLSTPAQIIHVFKQCLESATTVAPTGHAPPQQTAPNMKNAGPT